MLSVCRYILLVLVVDKNIIWIMVKSRIFLCYWNELSLCLKNKKILRLIKLTVRFAVPKYIAKGLPAQKSPFHVNQKRKNNDNNNWCDKFWIAALSLEVWKYFSESRSYNLVSIISTYQEKNVKKLT